MKKLFLKSGHELVVKILEITNEYRTIKSITVYRGSGYQFREHSLLFTVADGGFNNANVIFGDGVNELTFHHILAAAEIIENFGQYYGMLNQ